MRGLCIWITLKLYWRFAGYYENGEIAECMNKRVVWRDDVDERTDKSVHRWFGNIERTETNRITKRVYVWECTGIHLVDRRRRGGLSQ